MRATYNAKVLLFLPVENQYLIMQLSIRKLLSVGGLESPNGSHGIGHIVN